MKIRILLFFNFIINLSIAQTSDHNWSAYGGDPGGMRHAASTQITPENVKGLKVAWTYRSGELKYYENNKASEKAAFEATPIMLGGILYFSTPSNRVIAVDAVSGQEKWMFDPKVNLNDDYSEITSRGVSTWPGPDIKNDQLARRIFVATIDGRLIALSANSGELISEFGDNGTVDLRKGIGNISVTSPPAIIGNTIVIGSSMGDNQRMDYERGVVRAYDALTGKLRWSWDPIPQDKNDPAYSSWKGDRVEKTGAANAWAVLSVDPERDLVFIPTSCPSPDYYGGERLGQNLYANSIVALRASSGEMVWHFQTVHHDLWDYDIAAQPALINLQRNGKDIPAVVVGTKMGHIFILNREDGTPLFPVEERVVPKSEIEGEEAYPTQPYPVLPAPVGLHNVSRTDAWGLTEEDRKVAEKRMASLKNEGTFTPPSFEGTMVSPSNAGGIHWGGLTYDPQRKLLITNINRLVAVIRMIPRAQLKEEESKDKTLIRAETGHQKGTPYIMKRDYLFTTSDKGIKMQTKPPWGTLLAIDIETGDLKWEVPLGFMYDPQVYPEAVNWGAINLGGALTTAGGLTFVAATIDGYFRAFDTKRGKLLWQVALPAGGQSTPMSYQIDGKQFVVIAAGGHGKLSTTLGDYLIAYSLE